MLDLNKEHFATEEDRAYKTDYWARLFRAKTWEELRMLVQECNDLKPTVETIYRINAEEYARAQLEAREDELRVQRTIQYQHEQEIKERDEKLAEQQAQISEQQAQISEQQAQISEQQMQIQQYEALLKAHGISVK